MTADLFAWASARSGPTAADWLCVVEPWPGLPSDPDARTRRIQRGEWVLARAGGWDRMPDSPSPEWTAEHAFTLAETIEMEVPT